MLLLGRWCARTHPPAMSEWGLGLTSRSGLTEGLGVSIESLVGRSPLRDIIVRSCKVRSLRRTAGRCCLLLCLPPLLPFSLHSGPHAWPNSRCTMLEAGPNPLRWLCVRLPVCRTLMPTSGRAHLLWLETWPRRAHPTSSQPWCAALGNQHKHAPGATAAHPRCLQCYGPPAALCTHHLPVSSIAAYAPSVHCAVAAGGPVPLRPVQPGAPDGQPAHAVGLQQRGMVDG